jgi:hypothetical protein
MAKTYQPLFADSFLLANWSSEYDEYLQSGLDNALLSRLKNWSDKDFQNETKAEQAFTQTFFSDTWGYVASGIDVKELGYALDPKFAVEKAGQKGGTGEADLALGFFGLDAEHIAPTPQILCEFKDIRSGLDSPQNRKGNNRSPVKQCADYLREARAKLFGNEPIQPTWGIVSDMNEFRLYWWTNMPVQYQRFVIKPLAKHDTVALIDNTVEARFQRFLFYKTFHKDSLLTKGGKSALELLLQNQWIQEKELENHFYKEYRAFREKLFDALLEHNGHLGVSKGKLVRLSQRILDRLIFILYCEDMGKALSFPPHLLRDILRDISKATHYDPNGSDAWAKIKDIFRAMANGLTFAGHNINRFNGGLYAPDPLIDASHIPTNVFCAKGQDSDHTKDRTTLLYLSANYNFGVTGANGERVINLYTLGRIFEQSITELEIKVAEVEGKTSIGKLSKRKRDGVYYTPEWVTRFVVEQTIGRRLEELKKEVGLDSTLELTDDLIAAEALQKKGFKKDSKTAKYQSGLLRYRDALQHIKIVDPACGSGAFLIQALEFMLNERKQIAEDLARLSDAQVEIFDWEQEIRDILSNNIYGVDINAESVEITRLALWLHTALPNRPLSNLDSHIRCGNSLVGKDFYTRKEDLLSALNEDQRDRVNAFDWQATFPEVFSREDTGFDCVIGNPPYVKLQHFRKIDPDTTSYLKGADAPNAPAPYQSTLTGNFDLYLPFIEKGVHLLNDKGRMGYIAPSVWLRNEYGRGLRQMIHGGQHLDRWLDFVSFQVFDEAITYTSLQFYQKQPAPEICFANAPKGGLNVSDWESTDWQIPYSDLIPQDSWVLLPKAERKLFAKLSKSCKRLDDFAANIIVGIQTSADHIYHLEKRSADIYLHFPKKEADEKKAPDPIEIQIEDAIMRPLISGEESKRYETPKTDTYLLFPYDLSGERPRLWSESEMQSQFPHAWAYLKSHEAELRARESRKFDTEGWYQFGRNQNIDKQELSKLCVAQTVPSLRLFFDDRAAFYINNVRVNAILPEKEDDGLYLLSVLNSRTADFLFKRIGKPKAGGYYEANKQFIAPLPIPNASKQQKQELGNIASQLQALTTERRDKLHLAAKRLEACTIQKRPHSFLWPTINDPSYWKKQNPKNLKGRELTAWAKIHYEGLLEEKLSSLDAALPAGSRFDADYKDGELRLLVSGRVTIDKTFVDTDIGDFIAAQWQYLSRITNITDKTIAKTIADKLCKVYSSENAALKAQFVTLMQEVLVLEHQIDQLEADLNKQIYALYKLTDKEIQLVEGEKKYE